MAMQKLENEFDSLENFEILYPFMAVFVRFLTKLINDKNFKICECSLCICLKLVTIPNISQNCNLSALVPSCVIKLGDNKISIRMTSFKVLKQLLYKIRPAVIIPLLYQALDSQNWHIREEIVALLISSIILGIEYDYSELIEPLSKLLDDPKPKIKQVAIEALAVLQSKSDIIPSLEHLLDISALVILKNRFQNTKLPKLTEDYIEYPKISSGVASLTTFCTSPIQREDIFSAREDLPRKNTPKFPNRPVSELKETSIVSKSHNQPLRKFSPSEEKNDTESCYLSFEDLVPVKHPHEMLQRAMNRTDD